MSKEKIIELKKENEQENENKNMKKEREIIEDTFCKEKTYKKIIIVGIVVFFILAVLVCIIVLNYNNTKIINGILINGINVSNLTIDEAKVKINNNINNKEQNIKLKYEEYEVVVVPEQLEIKYNIDEAVNEAYKIGRKNNIFINNINILKSMFKNINIEVPININEEKLNELINNIESNISGTVNESSYFIEGQNLVILKGKQGIAVNYEQLKNSIIQCEKNNKKNDIQEINIPMIKKDPQPIDIDKIYNEIYREAKDAYYNEEPFEIFPHVLGIDFNISKEEAKQMINEDKEQYTIPLKIITPNITTDKLGDKAFPDLLSKYTTTYASSSANRKYNISRAANSINGKVILPGEVFSYNNTIGNPSQANGYRLATGFSNGKHVDSYGGGVCQVSSTLYNATVYANLDIISRYNHSLPVGYVPVSRDATVYYGGVDFKFKNNRKYPIKIVANTTGSAITIEIYGVKEENDYEVIIESWITERIPFATQYVDNPNLTQGTERVISKGANGYRSVAYKILKQNGQEISRVLLSSDKYSPENREVERGTKPNEEENPDIPESSPETEQTIIDNSSTSTEEETNSSDVIVTIE